MVTGAPGATGVPGEELVITRVFDAPRELVFAAWTDPRHVAQWWGPLGWTTPVCEIDLRPGGVWRYGIRSAEGQESWNRLLQAIPSGRGASKQEIADLALYLASQSGRYITAW